MKQMASSKKDYHHAKNPGKLLDVFSKVSKSLMQDRPKIVSKGDKKGKNHAEQVSSSRQSTDASDQGVSSSTKLAANQGFSFIENFLCHCCGDKQRLVCGECNQNLCGGGLTNNQVTCPTCNNVSEVELSDQAIGGVGKSSKGKGK